jgi:bifunctional UDP-N-acetylglucosamine pyrophosphorylase/glucosamine-1-phosphate N-acetyltransferase/UDP-N-acetylglucosamine pyrophosphorylase
VATLLAEFDRRGADCLMGTAQRDDPTGYGRIVRNGAGEFAAIVEEKDATADQKAIREVNLSTYVFNSRELLWTLDQLRADNSQGEYYITDCPGLLLAAGKRVEALSVLKPCEALSVNSPDELAAVEQELKRAATTNRSP